MYVYIYILSSYLVYHIFDLLKKNYRKKIKVLLKKRLKCAKLCSPWIKRWISFNKKILTNLNNPFWTVVYMYKCNLFTWAYFFVQFLKQIAKLWSHPFLIKVLISLRKKSLSFNDLFWTSVQTQVWIYGCGMTFNTNPVFLMQHVCVFSLFSPVRESLYQPLDSSVSQRRLMSQRAVGHREVRGRQGCR